MSKVFICYAHEDEKYLDLLLKHFDHDLLDVWSDKRIEGSEHWEEEIQKALDSANCGILILSASFFNSRFIKDIELQRLLQNQYEKNTHLLPVLAEHCNIDKYVWISKKEVLPKGFKAIENIKPRNHNKEAVKIIKRVEKLLEPQPEQTDGIKQNVVNTINYPDNPPATNNFPESNDDFFGRERYFDILDKAWDDEQVNILSFIAFGGIGKTSLIDNWLKRMKKDHYRGAKNIFMWSFYSQGSEEDRQVTATEFLLEACKFFKIKKIPKTAYEQGRKLADIISKQRALLVLDGLEPLQSSLEDIGEIKDNGLQVLLKGLSRQNKGLVVITSRIKLASIDNQYEKLEKLEDYEGAELLRSFELNGTNEELKKISNDFDGHALALKLLGSYTNVVLDKDISRIDEIESLRDDQSKSSNHATRMLNSYKKYLKDTIELDILKLLGFFDRAISFDVIDVLKNKPLIENINDKLVDISDREWKYALDKLRQLHLVSNNDKVLDTHPLVREYFSKYIEENYEDSYIKGHHRLYKYYENLPEKEYPDTIEEMEPLFQAIHHGCKTGEFSYVYKNLYRERINRKDRYYLSLNLARYDLKLSILHNFYDIPYSKFSKKIDNTEEMSIIKNLIDGDVANSLFTFGRSTKALQIYEQMILSIIDNRQENLLIAVLTNIMKMYLDMGDLNKVLKIYKNYKEKVPKEPVESYELFNGTYGYVLFLQGNIEEAKKIFLKIERSFLKDTQKITNLNLLAGNKVPIPKNIYSTMGYFLYKIYFYTKEYDEVRKRIRNSIEMSEYLGAKYQIGLDYITLGRLKIVDNERKRLTLNIFNKAIEYLRKSNEINYISEGLVQRAEAFRYYKKFKEANADLQEAYDLIIRSEAKLLLADWYIAAIKLANDEENFIKANTYFKEAETLSKELNEYFIFKEELKKLESNFVIEVKDE